MRLSLDRIFAAGLVLTGVANAQSEILVNSDIAVSTTWTANNTYNLQKQIYVLPGASLTIQAGTIVASTTGLGGSLAVAKGAQIFIQGTKDNPVIMTSKADVATWTAGNPKTGTWREAANEWGNLTLMGDAYVSSCNAGNTPAPNPANQGAMEGLVAGFPGDPKVLYGGGNDDDDSGTISYLSLRYGGKVIALNNELNGMSLGGIGRGTDINHIDIMNNVDDGIEVWGGTVELKYLNIWNVGDDSLDLDQGWRGKAQFGLLVQGYSLDAPQGSGVGDNCFETDGAEYSDYQPVTTASIYNFTVIGQPFDGDGMTAWRDNARVQYHNCIFMDGGEALVRFDNVDGDPCGTGYGYNGTLSWPATWTTDYTVTSTVNAPPNPAAFYKSQVSGKLAEIVDSVTFNVPDYTEANARGVFAPANNNVQEPSSMPITAITRGTAVAKGGKAMVPVTFLDPRPAADALTSVGFAPADGFFSQAKFRGAFAPGINWLNGWTASGAFGFTPTDGWYDLGSATAGVNGEPALSGSGTLAGGSFPVISLANARANSAGAVGIGVSQLNFPLLGGVLVPNPQIVLSIATDGAGSSAFSFHWPLGVPAGFETYFQAVIADAAGPQGFSFSNALQATAP